MNDELFDVQFVVYELGNEKHAIQISNVHEIIKYQQITNVYNSKPYLEGVINLRGKIIPVINMHKRLVINNYVPTKSTRIIVLQSREDMVGIIVDRVNQVVKFTDIQPPPDMIAGTDGSYAQFILNLN